MIANEKTARLLVTAGGPRNELDAQFDSHSQYRGPAPESQAPIDTDRGLTAYGQLLGLALEIDTFLLDLQVAHRSPHTVRFYRDKIRPFLDYLRSFGVDTAEAITPLHIRGFMSVLAQTHSPGGCCAYWRAIRAFLNFLVRDGVIHQNPLVNVRAPRVDEEPLEPVSPETIEALLATCDRSEPGLRDHSIIVTLLDTGLRASEAAALAVEDLDLRDGSILVRRSKSRKPRSVFAGKRARRSLLAYLRGRESIEPGEPLWLAYHTTGERSRLTYSGLRDIVRRRAKQASVTAPTLHSFRRAFAIMSLRNGADLVSLSRMMGHGSLPVLMRYLRQEKGDLGKVHQMTSPADGLKSAASGRSAWAGGAL